jgi:hypothetical protein
MKFVLFIDETPEGEERLAETLYTTVGRTTYVYKPRDVVNEEITGKEQRLGELQTHSEFLKKHRYPDQLHAYPPGLCSQSHVRPKSHNADFNEI